MNIEMCQNCGHPTDEGSRRWVEAMKRLQTENKRWVEIHHALQNRLTDHRFAMFDLLDAWDHDNTRLLDMLERMRQILHSGKPHHDDAPDQA